MHAVWGGGRVEQDSVLIQSLTRERKPPFSDLPLSPNSSAGGATLIFEVELLKIERRQEL